MDRLAAEFADELNNLGVRVANLERNADMVKWTGEARFIVKEDHEEHGKDSTTNRLELRFFPTAEINDNWKLKARITSRVNLKADDADAYGVMLNYVYAEGNYGNATVKLGKQDFFSTVDEGMVIDDFFSGARVTFGKNLKVNLEAGRWNLAHPGTPISYVDNSTDSTANYQGIDLYGQTGKLFAGASYKHLGSNDFAQLSRYGTSDDAGIWSVGARYTFDKNFSLFGAYANNAKADDYDRAAALQLDYKGANRANAGSWGMYLAYRYLGQNVALASTYDAIRWNKNVKGWEIGADYVLAKNITLNGKYFMGEDIYNGNSSKVFWTRLRYQF